MKKISENQVCKNLRLIRQEVGLSMADMATLLGYASPGSYQYYEDQKLYKKSFFENSFIEKLIEKLVPLGIKKGRIEALGLPNQSGTAKVGAIDENEIAMLYTIKTIIKAMLKYKAVDAKDLISDFSHGVDLFDLHHLPKARATLEDLNMFVKGGTPPIEPEALRKLLTLVPLGSA